MLYNLVLDPYKKRLHAWGDDPLVFTPQRNYTASEYHDLFRMARAQLYKPGDPDIRLGAGGTVARAGGSGGSGGGSGGSGGSGSGSDEGGDGPASSSSVSGSGNGSSNSVHDGSGKQHDRDGDDQNDTTTAGSPAESAGGVAPSS